VDKAGTLPDFFGLAPAISMSVSGSSDAEYGPRIWKSGKSPESIKRGAFAQQSRLIPRVGIAALSMQHGPAIASAFWNL
jgi:hypothetical protein